MMSSAQHLKNLYQKLLSCYGSQGWWPLYNKETGRIEYHPNDYSFPKNKSQSFEISVGAILTQNTMWKNAEKALLALHMQQLLSPENIKHISLHQLATIIKSSGYHTQKAKKLKAFVQADNKVTREDLLAIWGIGKETADSILLYAYKQPVFVVDSYTLRIFQRLEFPSQDYDTAQEFVHTLFPSDHAVYNELHALLVKHAKTTCTKQQPKCSACCLRKMCPFSLQ